MQNDPNSNYPRPNFMPQTPWGQRPPGVYFEFIGEAFQMVQKNWQQWVVVSLVALVASYAVNLVVSTILQMAMLPMISGMSRSTSPDPSMVVGLYARMGPLLALTYILTFFVTILVQTCVAHAAMTVIDGGSVDINNMFKPLSSIKSLWAPILLSSVALIIGLMLCFIPFFYVLGLLMIWPLACTEHQGTWQETLALVRSRTSSFAWRLGWLFFVSSFVSGLGLIACGIGILFTYSIYPIVIAMTYRTLFPEQTATASEGGVVPPPPTPGFSS